MASGQLQGSTSMIRHETSYEFWRAHQKVTLMDITSLSCSLSRNNSYCLMLQTWKAKAACGVKLQMKPCFMELCRNEAIMVKSRTCLCGRKWMRWPGWHEQAISSLRSLQRKCFTLSEKLRIRQKILTKDVDSWIKSLKAKPPWRSLSSSGAPFDQMPTTTCLLT